MGFRDDQEALRAQLEAEKRRSSRLEGELDAAVAQTRELRAEIARLRRPRQGFWMVLPAVAVLAAGLGMLVAGSATAAYVGLALLVTGVGFVSHRLWNEVSARERGQQPPRTDAGPRVRIDASTESSADFEEVEVDADSGREHER